MDGNYNSLSRYSYIHRTTLRSLTFLASWASKKNRRPLSTLKPTLAQSLHLFRTAPPSSGALRTGTVRAMRKALN